ncbi:hypothetical protein BIW11_12852 [Tropilaelaps mercedesae]|uniref:AH domain-containing protein n=1 Tax=Tropilaelaps mercedesae TaxID=418985 RepID=A0A1V9X596_9ACAR|nr:hypothetical protein BIW11_12852 [Tropilaelaps mercedesae]
MDGGSFSYYGRDVQDSVSRLQKKYWSTKQILIKKFGRKEDDSLVASDAELDAKLELFSAIYSSCVALERILENYQDRLSILSQEENAMGRFLKECGKQDKTRAGKMMTATGKSLAFTAQQRLTLRSPLIRLYQEVETYLVRAIADTESTVTKMEKSRTDYRGALLWMKEVSQKLDPDTHRQLERFRKVQGHVKKTKLVFEKLKVDTLQKVDLLSASRCNMFSHALAAYQQALLAFWEKTAQALAEVSDGFKGYQHYEFIVVKELTEPSKKLAEESGSTVEPESPSKKARAEGDADRALFYNPEWKDSPEHKVQKNAQNDAHNSTKVVAEQRLNATKNDDRKPTAPSTLLDADDDDEPLLSLENADPSDLSSILDDIFRANSAQTAPQGSFAREWENTFGQAQTQNDSSTVLEADLLGGAFEDLSLIEGAPAAATAAAKNANRFVLPSQLLSQQLAGLNVFGGTNNASSNATLKPSQPAQSAASYSNVFSLSQGNGVSTSTSAGAAGRKLPMMSKTDSSAWLGLFADLDPIANPDAMGAKKPQEERNC